MHRLAALDKEKDAVFEELKQSKIELKKEFKVLNNTSIKNDLKCLRYKISDKVKGVKHTNFEIKQIVSNKE